MSSLGQAPGTCILYPFCAQPSCSSYLPLQVFPNRDSVAIPVWTPQPEMFPQPQPPQFFSQRFSLKIAHRSFPPCHVEEMRFISQLLTHPQEESVPHNTQNWIWSFWRPWASPAGKIAPIWSSIHVEWFLRPFLYQVTTWQVHSSGFSDEKLEVSFPVPFHFLCRILKLLLATWDNIYCFLFNSVLHHHHKGKD